MIKRTSTGKRLRFSILHRDNFTCIYCGRKPPEVRLCVDHRTPVSHGGSNSPENLATACYTCNAGKSDAFSTGNEEDLERDLIGVARESKVFAIIDYKLCYIWISKRSIQCSRLKEAEQSSGNELILACSSGIFYDHSWLLENVPEIFENQAFPRLFRATEINNFLTAHETRTIHRDYVLYTTRRLVFSLNAECLL